MSLVQNIAPLLVALTSFVLYKDPLTKLDTATLLACFAGVALLVTGGNNNNSNSMNMEAVSLLIPSILLFAIPFNECAIQFTLRSIRNLSENSSTSWLVFAMFCLYMPVGVIQ